MLSAVGRQHFAKLFGFDHYTGPNGYSSLANQELYQKYRVLSSRIKVVFSPQAQVDSMVVCVTPSFSPSTPANVATAQDVQFTMTKSVQEGTPIGSQMVVNRIATHQLLGVRAQAILDDLSGQFNSAYNGTPANAWSWVINIALADNVVSVNPIPYRIEMEWEIEFFGDSTGQDLTTLAVVQTEASSKELLTLYMAAKAKEVLK